MATEPIKPSRSKEPNWEKYGLRTEPYGAVDTEHRYESGRRESGAPNELFKDLSGDQEQKPWWGANFFIRGPVLFGTWDGVFTSCVINIFGVIIFLRTGWMVAEAGIAYSVLIVVMALIVILTAVVSGLAICSRCHAVDKGGIYFVISHVLGGKIGATIGILYCFGQAVGAALHAIGFGESIGRLLEIDNPWTERGIAAAILCVLMVINVAGVTWVIKLQFALFALLLLAALDFAIGSFVWVDTVHGVDGYFSHNFVNNTGPSYSEGNDWFTVFGVFFPALCGVFAGINMSGDLKDPSKSIPVGTLTAIVFCSGIYLMFILILGATCARWALRTDYMITAKVSAAGVFLLTGLYVSSLSACLGALYGTPRILQSIAEENVIPRIRILGQGRGANQVPVWAILTTGVVTLLFILVGQINTLAPIVTMPFLITYAAVNYAYFALAQSYDLTHRRKDLLKDHGELPATFDATTPVKSPIGDYGSIQTSKDVAKNDLDRLFPERTKFKTSGASSLHSSTEDVASVISQVGGGPASSITSGPDDASLCSGLRSPTDEHKLTDINSKYDEITEKPHTWYSIFCNRWVSLFGVVANLLIMFLVDWEYALIHLAAFVVLYLYVKQASPISFPGVADFEFYPWVRDRFRRHILRRGSVAYSQVLVTPLHPGVEVLTSQLNEENSDYASREKFHQSKQFKKRIDEFDD